MKKVHGTKNKKVGCTYKRNVYKNDKMDKTQKFIPMPNNVSHTGKSLAGDNLLFIYNLRKSQTVHENYSFPFAMAYRCFYVR